MEIRAYGKVNLCLDVVGKKEDGYHQLDMIMVPIELHDRITLETAQEMSFTCTPDIRIRPQNNSILKMIELLREKFGFKENFAIHLEKNIPSQAGLGGGSSDAAAVLNALNEHFGWGLSDQQKISIGVQIGADVPYCLFNRPARVRGIGEDLEFFEVNLPMNILLVQPYKGVSTRLAFAGLQLDSLIHPDSATVQQALVENKYPLFLISIGNSLESSAIQLVPEISRIKQRLLRAGMDKSLMTGSGSVVMGFSQQDECIDSVYEILKPMYRFVTKTKILAK